MRWFGLCASLFVAVSAVPAMAANVSNGRFETGDYSGWAGGGVDDFFGIVTDAFGVPAIQGQHSALIVELDEPSSCMVADPWSSCSSADPWAASPITAASRESPQNHGGDAR